MNISILTSRYGPNDRQITRFEELLSNQFNATDGTIINHGGDEGDGIIHDKCLIQKFTVEIHPCFKIDRDTDDFFPQCKIHERRRMEDRNRHLISIADVVIAMPQYMNGWEDSPMWKTIRAGIAGEKELYVISPEGYCWKFWR